VRTSVNAGFSVTGGRNEMKFGPGVCFHGVQRYFFLFLFPLKIRVGAPILMCENTYFCP
jgi:hypothetical protein